MFKLKKPALVAAALSLLIVCLAGSIVVIKPSNAKSKNDKETEAAFKAMQLHCPKCQGNMEYGMPDDYYQTSAGSWDQAYWSPAVMGKSFFAKSPVRRRIYAFRCLNCGYLESYAK